MTIPKSTKPVLTIFFFLLLFVLYYFTSFDKVSFGDCIGYINIVEQGDYVKTATSSIHFLYTNSLVLFKNITNLETILSVKLFNTIASTVALFIIYKTINLLFNSYKLSILGTLIFAFSFTFWRMSTTIEVCSFNTIFLGLFLYFSILFFKLKNSKHLLFASIILGVSFWVHVQNIMVIPSLLYMYYIAYKRFSIDIKISFLLLISLAILKFLPSYLQGESLINVYGSNNPLWVTGTFNKSILQYLIDIIKALGYIVYNYWYFTIPALISIFYRFKKPSYLNLFFSIGFIIPFAFGTFYNVSDNYVYFIGPYLILLIYIIDGLTIISSKYKNIINLSFALTLTIPLLYVATYYLLINTKQGQEFHTQKDYKGGLNYYLYPWLNNNAGILEYTIEKKTSIDNIPWMTEAAKEFINKRKTKNTLEEIKEM